MPGIHLLRNRRRFPQLRFAGRLGLVVALLLMMGCGTTYTPRADYDRQINFAGYRSFHWLADDPLIGANGADAEVGALHRQRIITAIEHELTAKGFTRAATREQADFVVAFTVGARDRIDIDAFPYPYRGPWYWDSVYWGQWSNTRVYREGVLAVDIFDQQRHAPVWHGWVSKRISASDIENSEPVINAAVREIMLDFPPR